MIGLLRACSGLIVWAAIFSLLYAAEGIGCAQRWETGVLRTLLVAIWLIGIAALVVMSARAWSRRANDLIAWMTCWLAITGLVATIVTGAPVASLTLCL